MICSLKSTGQPVVLYLDCLQTIAGCRKFAPPIFKLILTHSLDYIVSLECVSWFLFEQRAAMNIYSIFNGYIHVTLCTCDPIALQAWYIVLAHDLGKMLLVVAPGTTEYTDRPRPISAKTGCATICYRPSSDGWGLFWSHTRKSVQPYCSVLHRCRHEERTRTVPATLKTYGGQRHVLSPSTKMNCAELDCDRFVLHIGIQTNSVKNSIVRLSSTEPSRHVYWVPIVLWLRISVQYLT